MIDLGNTMARIGEEQSRPGHAAGRPALAARIVDEILPSDMGCFDFVGCKRVLSGFHSSISG